MLAAIARLSTITPDCQPKPPSEDAASSSTNIAPNRIAMTPIICCGERGTAAANNRRCIAR